MGNVVNWKKEGKFASDGGGFEEGLMGIQTEINGKKVGRNGRGGDAERNTKAKNKVRGGGESNWQKGTR